MWAYEHRNISRNSLCFCDSNKKYKKCCGKGFSLSQKEIKPLSGKTQDAVSGLFSRLNPVKGPASSEGEGKEEETKSKKKA